MIGPADILRGRILIVDDQQANVMLLEQMLQEAGYVSVSSTQDPLKVCALHAKNRYHLIVLDLQMPGMDGFQVMEGLREIEGGNDLPVLVITAQPQHKLRALKAGAKDFITKPFDLAEVMARVHNMLEVRLLNLDGTLLNLARLENSQRIARLGDWELDLASRRLVWSDEIYSILGVSRDGCPPNATAFDRSVHPDDLDLLHQEQAKVALDGSRHIEFEHRIILPTGEIRHLHQIAEMTLDGQRRPIRESGTIQDVTDRILAEAALRESEQWLKAIFEQAAVGVAQIDVATQRFVRVNRRFCDLVGFTQEEMGRRTLAEITHEQDVGLNAREMAQMRDGSIREFAQERRLVRGDGAIVWASLALSSIGTPGKPPANLIVVAQDITERKRVDREIQRQAAFAQFNPDPVLELSAAGEITYSNEAAGKMARSLGADTPTQVLPDNIAEVVSDCLSLSETIRLETQTHGRTVSWMFFPVASNQVVHCRAGDVTEQKRLEEHFLQAQKMEALGQFSGGVAHDFNNILAAISGYTELAQMTLTGNPAVRVDLAAVLQATHRATDLVRQILSFSRQQPQTRLLVRLQPIVDESLKLIRVTIPSTIEFEVTSSPDAPTVLADMNQVHQILMNLGTNAWHAMRDRPGTLKVTLERCEVDAAHAAGIPRLRPGVFARLSVSDTGCGMEPTTLHRIFEPFFTTKPPGEGTGLGLAVVKSIMDHHDGAVVAESQPGKGTSFHLYFPERMGEVAEAEAGKGPTPLGHGERILVVDDEPLLADLGQKALTALGYEVESTTLPSVALARVAADPRRFALVLLDQTMPGMSGLLLATQLQQVMRGIPIILTSGYTASLTAERLEAAGVVHLLLKPSSIHSLGTAVHAALLSCQSPV